MIAQEIQGFSALVNKCRAIEEHLIKVEQENNKDNNSSKGSME